MFVACMHIKTKVDEKTLSITKLILFKSLMYINIGLLYHYYARLHTFVIKLPMCVVYVDFVYYKL